MKSKAVMCLAATTLFAALSIPARLAAQEQQQQKKGHIRYTVIDLGLASEWIGGINDKGWLDYTAILPDGTQHATLLRRGRQIDLGTLGGPNSNPFYGPSERGQVVGKAETSTKDPLGEDYCGFGTNLICLGFVWQNGSITPLPTLGGNNSTSVRINNRGDIIVGSAETNIPDATCPPPQVLLQSLPVFWKNGEIHELPTIPGDPDGGATAINDRGQIVGVSADCTTPFHAVLWQDGAVTNLGSLGGTNLNFAQSINNRGQVVGFSAMPGDTTNDAFLWTEDDGMKDLGTLPGDFSSGAWSINNKGQVVGLSGDVNGNQRAFIWQDGVMADLNEVIPPSFPFVLVEAFEINDRGEIVGLAVDPKTDEGHAFLAIPCDEKYPNRTGCTDEGIVVSPGESSERPKVSLPAKVRKRFQPRGR